jgi:hypothetical protein
MTESTILERLLDRAEETIKDLASLKTQNQQIVDHLSKLNGSVAKHQEWIATNGQAVRALEEDLKSLKTCNQVSNQTMLKIAALAAGVALAISHAEGPLLATVVELLK